METLKAIVVLAGAVAAIYWVGRAERALWLRAERQAEADRQLNEWARLARLPEAEQVRVCPPGVPVDAWLRQIRARGGERW